MEKNILDLAKLRNNFNTALYEACKNTGDFHTINKLYDDLIVIIHNLTKKVNECEKIMGVYEKLDFTQQKQIALLESQVNGLLLKE